jgi:hypothetical protein
LEASPSPTPLHNRRTFLGISAGSNDSMQRNGAPSQGVIKVSDSVTITLGRAIYGDLFPVVPNIENRNNFAALN